MSEPAINRILVPVDFADMTGKVLDYAGFLARTFDAVLEILYVLHVPHFTEAGTWLEPVISPSVEQDVTRQLEDTVSKKLEDFAAGCREKGLRVEAKIRNGVPFAEILACAEEDDADMIVMGSQGRTGISHFLVGSVAERVMRRARCSVLVVKPAADEQES